MIEGIEGLPKMEALSRIGGDYEFRVYEGNIELRSKGCTLLAGVCSAQIANGDNSYMHPIGDCTSIGGNDTNKKMVMPYDAVLTDFFVRMNNGTNNTVVVTVEVNSAATGLTISFAASANTTKSNKSGIVRVYEGDVITIYVDTTASNSGAIQGMGWSLRCTALVN